MKNFKRMLRWTLIMTEIVLVVWGEGMYVEGMCRSCN